MRVHYRHGWEGWCQKMAGTRHMSWKQSMGFETTSDILPPPTPHLPILPKQYTNWIPSIQIPENMEHSFKPLSGPIVWWPYHTAKCLSLNSKVFHSLHTALKSEVRSQGTLLTVFHCEIQKQITSFQCTAQNTQREVWAYSEEMLDQNPIGQTPYLYAPHQRA